MPSRLLLSIIPFTLLVACGPSPQPPARDGLTASHRSAELRRHIDFEPVVIEGRRGVPAMAEARDEENSVDVPGPLAEAHVGAVK